jgi:hypothetical protein
MRAIRSPKILKKKRCKWCEEEFQPKTSLESICSYNCAIERAKDRVKKKEEKAVKEEKKVWNKEIKEKKDKLKTLSDYEADARRIFQRWIRKRDKDLPCISCDRSNTDFWDAGHYFDAGIYSGLIFHEDNVHKQCSRPCNKDYHGNKINYRLGLVQKIGEERVRWLEENKDRLRNYKYKKEELIAIKKEYNKRLKE